jgi:hypothetical protein
MSMPEFSRTSAHLFNGTDIPDRAAGRDVRGIMGLLANHLAFAPSLHRYHYEHDGAFDRHPLATIYGAMK